MNLADLLLVLLLAGAFSSSCYLLRHFFLNWDKAWLQENLAPVLPLRWTDFALFLAGFLLCFLKAHELLIPYCISAVLALLLIRGFAPFEFWKLDARDLPHYVKTGVKTYLTMFVPFFFLTYLCNILFGWLGFNLHQPAMEMFMAIKGFWPMFGFLVFACVLAPMWEEMTFRGFLYPFLKSKFGRNAALLLSALLFSAMHLHAPSFIPLAVFGALLALLYERTGSLGFNILLHSCFNLSTCLVVLLMKYGLSPRFLQFFE